MSDRLCPECHAPVTGDSMHKECRRIRNARKNSTRSAQAHNSQAHRTIRTILIANNPNAYCDQCGNTWDLTIDYRRPISAGGPMALWNARVLCRSCNSRKGAHERVSDR